MDLSALGQVFRGSDAVAAGLITPAQLRSDDVTRLFRDVYIDSRRPVTHVLRCLAATLALADDAVITGRSAATVEGIPLAWPEDDVQVVAPTATRIARRTGVLLRRTSLAPDDHRQWGHGRIATPERIALDLLLGRPVLESVPDMDAVLRAGLVDREHMQRVLAGRSDNGVVIAREALRLVDTRSQSLPESRVRVMLVLAGLDPIPQYKIRLGGGVVAAADLGFPERRVVVEYDGDWRDGEQWALNRDRHRLNQVQEAGWRVVFVTAPMNRKPARSSPPSRPPWLRLRWSRTSEPPKSPDPAAHHVSTTRPAARITRVRSPRRTQPHESSALGLHNAPSGSGSAR